MRQGLWRGLLAACLVLGTGMRVPDPVPVDEATLGVALASAGFSLVELNTGRTTALAADRPFPAGELALLPLVLVTAQQVASGRWRWHDPVGGLAEPAYGPVPEAERVLPLMPLRSLVALAVHDRDPAAARTLTALLGPETLAAALSDLGLLDTRLAPEDGQWWTSARDLTHLASRLARAEVGRPELAEEVLSWFRAPATRAERRVWRLADSRGRRHEVTLVEQQGLTYAMAVLAETAASPSRPLDLAESLHGAVEAGSRRNWSKLPVVRVPSHNHSSRQGAPIDMIVLHHTVIGPGAQEVADYFRRPDIEASSHYIVGKDGLVIQAVDDCLNAWHAGVSAFRGRPSVNKYSIGIEIVNRGDGLDPYPEAQYRALARLVRQLQQEYGIPWDRVTGHKDVALPKGRKTDPSVNFSYRKLKAEIDRLERAEGR